MEDLVEPEQDQFAHLLPVSLAMYSLDGDEDLNGKDSCWGQLLGATKCAPAFKAGKMHFKNKFCDVCRARGFRVSPARVRVTHPDSSFAPNSTGGGFWNVPASPHAGYGKYRLINQTAKCHGTPLLVFAEPCGQQVGLSDMPLDYIDEGKVMLKVSAGTLVPVDPSGGRRRRRTKRPADDEEPTVLAQPVPSANALAQPFLLPANVLAQPVLPSVNALTQPFLPPVRAGDMFATTTGGLTIPMPVPTMHAPADLVRVSTVNPFAHGPHQYFSTSTATQLAAALHGSSLRDSPCVPSSTAVAAAVAAALDQQPILSLPSGVGSSLATVPAFTAVQPPQPSAEVPGAFPFAVHDVHAGTPHIQTNGGQPQHSLPYPEHLLPSWMSAHTQHGGFPFPPPLPELLAQPVALAQPPTSKPASIQVPPPLEWPLPPFSMPPSPPQPPSAIDVESQEPSAPDRPSAGSGGKSATQAHAGVQEGCAALATGKSFYDECDTYMYRPGDEQGQDGALDGRGLSTLQPHARDHETLSAALLIFAVFYRAMDEVLFFLIFAVFLPLMASLYSYAPSLMDTKPRIITALMGATIMHLYCFVVPLMPFTHPGRQLLEWAWIGCYTQTEVPLLLDYARAEPAQLEAIAEFPDLLPFIIANAALFGAAHAFLARNRKREKSRGTS